MKKAKSIPPISGTWSPSVELVGDVAKQAGFSCKEVYSIQLATDEACSNIIEHAYARSPEGMIDIACDAHDGQFTMVIHDHGKEFDMSRVRKPNLSKELSEREVGGLGVYLIHKLMDEVHFSSSKKIGQYAHHDKEKIGGIMTATVASPNPSEWRRLASLGEQLASADSLAAQQERILQMTRRLVDGRVSLWLDEGLFRLPDREAAPLFSAEPPPGGLRRAWQTGQITRSGKKAKTSLGFPAHRGSGHDDGCAPGQPRQIISIRGTGHSRRTCHPLSPLVCIPRTALRWNVSASDS